MAVGPNGEIDVFWHSDPEGDNTTDAYNHARSVDGGVSFTASQALASGGLIDVNGRGVRYDLNGHVHVQYAFLQDSNTPSTVYEVIGQSNTK